MHLRSLIAIAPALAAGGLLFSLVAIATPPPPDTDGDGYPDSLDCGPTDPTIHPRAVEIPYDGIDQDCNGSDLCDVDLDGFDAIVCGGTDCDDNDATVYPGAIDIPGDGIDQDCSGADADPRCDLDGDGHLSLACGGADCHDLDPTVYPGAVEIINDGIDQSCDGTDHCQPVSWVQGGACSAVPANGLAPGLFLLLLPLALRRREVR
jgi:hypothetical protein